jgi:carbamoyl-phosphate synthase large subunit
MPKRQDIKKILIIGSGPIVIGQACEFDYSGTQACKALMREGYEVILVNSNPATIMTDPEIATKVYVEPLKFNYLEKIIETERPQAVIPTLGGQTALNLALELYDKEVLKKYGVELLGADPKVIRAAEDRELFRGILDRVEAKYPKSIMVRTFEAGQAAARELGYPLILRPNYTLGGGGGGIAYSADEYNRMIVAALMESPTSEVLVEESILGWKEFELEVMRDSQGSFVIVCSIENLDPCGVHTGDSITVAPQQTLTDRQYQEMRDEACRIINEVGVQTGGANIQFAVHPTTNERLVIEMNPRVSRSSALASKATGFPIAKIAAQLAVGYNLHELKNDITKVTPTCFEPALDYVVTKIPRFAFEKFPGTKDLLTTQMRSVGEVMAIGRTFQESLMKAMSSLEGSPQGIPELTLDISLLGNGNSRRIYHLFQAFREGMSVSELAEMTQITPWFLEQINQIVTFESEIEGNGELTPQLLLNAKRRGFSDARIGQLLNKSEAAVTEVRAHLGIHPGFFMVDTCAGEFQSNTPYFYSTYWTSKGQQSQFNQPIAVIGSGPNRIGQGIEFDYSCVRGVRALQKSGHQVLMINSNPETVSTDYDTSDILFFEPLTLEHINEVFRFAGVQGFIAQLGGQTPINLAKPLVEKGWKLLGSSVDSIDLAEDRGRFGQICTELGLRIPKAAVAPDIESAEKVVHEIGFPVICRPSYVLGGRRMEVIESLEELRDYFRRHREHFTPQSPCLVDQFLEGALEIDVDVVRGMGWCLVGGVIEHIEAAGVHSGDSMGVIPPQRLKDETCKKIEILSTSLANRMNIIGHMNLQIAVKNDEIFVLEANPRSSRTVPFLAKATKIPLVDLGILAVLGEQVDTSKYNWRNLDSVCVKGVVFPFKKFPEADSILGPEMKSTGETMGRGADYSEALMKAFMASQTVLPTGGEVFFSLRNKDKEIMLALAKDLQSMGFSISATKGTATYLGSHGVECRSLRKVYEGRPSCVDRIRSGAVTLVINTTSGKRSIEDSFEIRRACTDYNIPCLTETDAAEVFTLALKRSAKGQFTIKAL